MAPEIYTHQISDPKAIDIFAAGVILFIMIFNYPPFYRANQKDKFYN